MRVENKWRKNIEKVSCSWFVYLEIEVLYELQFNRKVILVKKLTRYGFCFRKIPLWNVCCIFFDNGREAETVKVSFPDTHVWSSRFHHWYHVHNVSELSALCKLRSVLPHPSFTGRSFWVMLFLLRNCPFVQQIAIQLHPGETLTLVYFLWKLLTHTNMWRVQVHLTGNNRRNVLLRSETEIIYKSDLTNHRICWGKERIAKTLSFSPADAPIIRWSSKIPSCQASRAKRFIREEDGVHNKANYVGVGLKILSESVTMQITLSGQSASVRHDV